MPFPARREQLGDESIVSLCRVAGGTDLPDALVRVLVHPGLRARWETLSESDRDRYASWIATANTARSRKWRTRVVEDRIREGRGWVGQPRRLLDHLFSVPSGVTAEDAYNSGHRGSSEFG